MSLYAESSGGTFKPVPAGMHLARLYRIIDLGTQRSEFDGNVNFLHKVKFVWEIHGDDDSGAPIVTDKGEPMIITKDYTLSWGEKANLRKDLEAWRGRPFTQEEQRRFDLKNVLDKWCMVNVQHKPRQKGGVYANVVSVTPVPTAVRNAGLPDGFNKPEIFTISEPDMNMFNGFGEYLKKTIEASPEWQAMLGRTNTGVSSRIEDIEDDIPF